MLRNENGVVLVEFAFAMIIFLAFIYGLFAVSWWGIGSLFIQESAHEAAQKYAITLDKNSAEQRATARLQNWAPAFVKKDTVQVHVSRKGDRAVAKVSAVPLVKKLYLFDMPYIEKSSSCTVEYRFRHPEEFAK